MKDFSMDWRNMIPSFHHISPYDPANQSRSAGFCVIEISNYSTLNPILKSHHLLSTSSCVPFYRRITALAGH
jgi:hypothetical protein